MLPIGRGGQQIIVMHQDAERDQGKKAILGNLTAAKAVADILRTTLGPLSMLKMILDPMGGIVLTNDGNCVLREIDVNHPAAKSMIELSRTQDENVGDGTTSVIILAGELLSCATEFIERRMHPRKIVAAYNAALADALEVMKSIAIEIDPSNEEGKQKLLNIISSTIGTKYVSRYGDTLCNLALKAVDTIREVDETTGRVDIDIKRFARVERVPGGEFIDSRVLDGVMINKDVLHPKMRRRIENPKIICLDCPLEYNKGESQTNIAITQGGDFETYLRLEEEYIMNICDKLLALQPDIIVTEKGCAELTQHILMKNGVTVLRRMRKTDNVRLARACGATIGSRVDLLKESNVGTQCGSYEVRQLAGETFSFFENCVNPKACTVLLRGGSKDILQEMDRNLQDAMAVTRNILLNPKIVPGGGATEIAIAVALSNKANLVEGEARYPYQACGRALEVIPRILIQNCGKSPIRVLTELRAKHAEPSPEDSEKASNYTSCWGIDGMNGTLVNMHDYGIWEPYVVKSEALKTAIGSSTMLLRIDDVVSGIRNKDD